MSTATDSQLDVEITVTETAPCTKQIKLRVPAAAVDGRLEAAFGSFAMEAAMPGFRKGKAPRALIEKRFGGAVAQETRQQLMSEAYGRAIEEHKPSSDHRTPSCRRRNGPRNRARQGLRVQR